MKLNIKNDFWLVNTVSLLLILVISFFPNPILRNILGWPFLVYIPGYTLTGALFPRKNQIGTVERVTFSIGLSVALLPIMGLILNLTPWGIRLYPILIATTIFILVTSSVAWYRRRRLNTEERTLMSLDLNFSRWRSLKLVDRLLSIFLAVAIIGATAVIVYNVLNPRGQETFTEFYMLGITGKAENYIREIPVNKPVELTLGVISHEDVATSYVIAIMINGQKTDSVSPIVLAPGEKWEDSVKFTPTGTGDNQKVEFYLYRENETSPYLEKPLRLWITVIE